MSKLEKLVLGEENVGLNIDAKCYNQNGIYMPVQIKPCNKSKTANFFIEVWL